MRNEKILQYAHEEMKFIPKSSETLHRDEMEKLIKPYVRGNMRNIQRNIGEGLTSQINRLDFTNLLASNLGKVNSTNEMQQIVKITCEKH